MASASNDTPRLGPDALARALRARPAARVEDDDVRRAAVALVFGPRLDLLFIRRSEVEGDPWSGHMALPGGRVEPHDPSLRAAAMRETHEEVGLDLVGARFLGPLDELSSPVRKGRQRLVISPFAWHVPAPVTLRLNREVARTYWFDVHRLLAGEGRTTFDLRWQGRVVPMPKIQLGDADIWGLTLRVVDDLLDRVSGSG